MVDYIIKIENLPTFSGQKTDMLIGFSVVGLAKNTLWVMNLMVRKSREILDGRNSKILLPEAYFSIFKVEKINQKLLKFIIQRVFLGKPTTLNPMSISVF